MENEAQAQGADVVVVTSPFLDMTSSVVGSAGENESLFSSEDFEDDEGIRGPREKFHNTVRENIIFLLFFLTLGIISWIVICRFIKKREDETRGSVPADDDESLVYRICFWICVFSLSISIGGTLLLPISIVSNEVLLLYPKWYYVQWLNGLLVQGLWNLIFLFANISLFILLPFAYFFIESEGFSGNKKGILPKVYETIVILALAGFTVFCFAFVLASLLLSPDESRTGMSGLFILSFLHQLPFIYSCISFFGVLLLLVSTPLGFARLFTILSQLLVGPQFIRNLDDEILSLHLAIDAVAMEIKEQVAVVRKLRGGGNGIGLGTHNGTTTTSAASRSQMSLTRIHEEDPQTDLLMIEKILKMKSLIPDQEKTFQSIQELEGKLRELKSQLVTLQKMSQTPGWKRNLLYPLLLLLVLALTALAVIMVVLNTLQLLVGFKRLPAAGAAAAASTLGLSSISVLGPSGAALEVILIFYLIFTSLIGLYNLPGIRSIRPVVGDTPTSNIIYNCTLLLITSSALPLLARILGITNFDLLGNYGKIQWLRSFYLVVGYNVGFSVASSLCLINKFTVTVRQEILKRLKIVFNVHIPLLSRTKKSRISSSSSAPVSANSSGFLGNNLSFNSSASDQDFPAAAAAPSSTKKKTE